MAFSGSIILPANINSFQNMVFNFKLSWKLALPSEMIGKKHYYYLSIKKSTYNNIAIWLKVLENMIEKFS